MEEEQKNTGQAIIDKGEHHVSRQELGHNAWQLLHMMTGSFPDEIPEPLVKKFNVFLINESLLAKAKARASRHGVLIESIGILNRFKYDAILYTGK